MDTALLGLLLNGDNVARYPFTLREPLILSTTHKLTANVFTDSLVYTTLCTAPRPPKHRLSLLVLFHKPKKQIY